ncbi:MAG: hypothetical protein I8H80_02050 [Alphaproteobacteria bacterium]|nr:hypothetical protein [Alphaproteobacteria bacterium]
MAVFSLKADLSMVLHYAVRTIALTYSGNCRLVRLESKSNPNHTQLIMLFPYEYWVYPMKQKE